MKQLILAAALAAAMVPTIPSPLPAQDAAAIVDRAARMYRNLTSLRADFTQVIDNPMLGSATSRGTLTQAGPNQLAMRFSDPKGEAIVIDGKYIWIYTPGSTPGQVIRMNLPKGGAGYGFNLLGWFLDQPAERYDMQYIRRDAVGGRPVDVVSLTPKSDSMPFTSATIWLDRASGLPRKLEIHERTGGTRTLTLTDVKTNAPVPKDVFEFKVPDGVRVVDQ